MNKDELDSIEVLLSRTSPMTLRKDVETILYESGLREHYDVKRRTLIKINANYDRFYPGCNTSTWFLDALLFALKKLGFINMAIVENDLKLQPAERTIEFIGVKNVCEKHNVPFINLGKEKIGEDELPLILYESQIINVPVIHTHTFAVISCACKNLFGFLPVDREKYHNVLSEKLLWLYERIRPCFTIVDGTIGLDGGSMRMGNPRRLDLILAGWDPLAIDLVVSKIAGFSKNDVPLLRLAEKRGLLRNPRLRSNLEDQNDLPKFKFKYKESKVAKIDLWLRRSKLTRGLFTFNSIPDRLAHHVRRSLLSVNYFLKKGKILNSNLMEYAKYQESYVENEDLSSY